MTAFPDLAPAAVHDEKPPQNAVGRAFAGVTLAAALFMIVGSFVPWANIWDSTYGYIPIQAIGVHDNGAPMDGVFSLAVGLGIGCVGAVRLATRIALSLRLMQMLVGGLMVWMTLYDLSHMRYPAAGVFMVMSGGAMAVVGGFPFAAPAQYQVELGRMAGS